MPSTGFEASNHHEIRNIRSVLSIPTSILSLQGSRAGYRTPRLPDYDWQVCGNCDVSQLAKTETTGEHFDHVAERKKHIATPKKKVEKTAISLSCAKEERF
jgi:hypothetical protein